MWVCHFLLKCWPDRLVYSGMEAEQGGCHFTIMNIRPLFEKKNYSLENVLLLYIHLIPSRTWVLNILNILLVGCIIIHLEQCFSTLVALVNHLGSFLKMSKLGPTSRDSDLIVLVWGPGKGIFKKHPRCFKCVVKMAAHYWFRGGTVLFKCS